MVDARSCVSYVGTFVNAVPFCLFFSGIDSMSKTIKAETGKEFMFSEKFGFIHSCPSNLGTGISS